MKSNAIVRIVIWSVVIFVLLAILIAGLGSNLFTLFHGSTDTVYHSTDVVNSESPSGQSDTPIAERSVSVVSQTSVYTMPNTQSASAEVFGATVSHAPTIMPCKTSSVEHIEDEILEGVANAMTGTR